MKEYLPRIVDDILKFKLESKGAVWIRGPKWCGKSTTAERFAKTCIYMQDENTREQNIQLAKLNPSLFLSGETPLLIDEWQSISFIWNQIRHEVDKRDEFGQFILTGSSLPNNDLTSDIDFHSGTGRITNLIMRPMSLFESKESNGQVSLKSLFESNDLVASKCDNSILDYCFYTARGGWPKAINCSERVALQQAIDYYDGLINSDIKLQSKYTRQPERIKLLMKSYARNCSTQANLSTIKNDMLANDNSMLNEDTILSYINNLKKLYVVEESEAWNPNLRSKTAVRTTNTRYFVDPSIACAALGINSNGLIKDLKTFGMLFENLCIRDLRIYADSLDATVKHYRDANGLECDAVITLRDGSYGLIEIKLGNDEFINEGANNLLKLKKSLADDFKQPSFMMILTTSNLAYKRDDGVLVVPLASLKP